MSTVSADDEYETIPGPAQFAARRARGAVLRDVLALLLVVAGAVGLTAAGFMVSVEAGIAVCSLVAIATGVALGLDR